MRSDPESDVWSRAGTGRHVLVRGRVPAVPDDWLVLRISGHDPARSHGPLQEAVLRIAQTLGDDDTVPSLAGRRSSAARRMLGEDDPVSLEATFIEACNRLAAASDQPSALLLESLEVADAALLTSLGRILARTDWLLLPLVLHVGVAHRLRALDRLVEQAGGSVVVIGLAANEPAPAPPAAAPAQAVWDWQHVPPEVLRVLRAAAAFGEHFDAPTLATLLDESPLDILEALQEAADHGAPLIDHGGGKFALHAASSEALRATLLPSLLAAWHARIAESIVAGGGPRARGARVADHPAPARHAPPMAPAVRDEERGDAAQTARDTAPPPGYADTFEPAGGRQSASPPAPAPEAPRPAPAARRRIPVRDADGTVSPDLARAADHLQQAGRVSDAALAYLEAAEQRSREGDTAAARRQIAAAQALLAQVTPLSDRNRLRALAAIAEARSQWLASGEDAGDTLPEALRSIESARAVLGDDPPPDVLAEIAAVHAGIAYDLGEPDTLQGALDALVEASRALLAAGDSLRAARLLNDQAALNLRFGDPVQAVNLLTRSREIFSGLDASEAVQAELAETDHLLAKMPLHARIRPGQEDEALRMALANARHAEQTFAQLGRVRDLARVWETIARLHMASGSPQAAVEELSRAAEQQQRLGDATGLARTTAAYTELLLSAGRPEQALATLAESIALNERKGSHIGLEFNARALAQIQRALESGAPQLRTRALELQAALDTARARLR